MADQLIPVTLSFPADLRLGDNAKRIIQLRFEHPDWTQERIGKEVGLSLSRTNAILNHPRVVASFPMVAKQRLAQMVPKAMKAYNELVDQKLNLQVREKAASRVLSEQRVFDAPTVKVEGQITLKSVSELGEIVRKASETLQNVVDAEIIPDETPSLDTPNDNTK